MNKKLENCAGCTDRRSEGTHAHCTIQHPPEPREGTNCGVCRPIPKPKAVVEKCEHEKALESVGHVCGVCHKKIEFTQTPASTEVKCELYLDHTPVWAGDGYFCSKCMLRFEPFPASTEEWELFTGNFPTKEQVFRYIPDEGRGSSWDFTDYFKEKFAESVARIKNSHDQQLRQRIVEWAADERDKADAHYAKEQDDYSQGYFMAMNTVMKHLETPPSSPTYK